MEDRKEAQVGVQAREHRQQGERQIAETSKQAPPLPSLSRGTLRKLPRGRRLLLLICVVVLIIGGLSTALTAIAYPSYNALYHKDVSLAQDGVQHLRNAVALLQALPKKSFDASAVTHARQEFLGATGAFTAVRQSLNALPSALTLVPVYGSRLSAALRLLPMAIEASQAGVIGCNILNMLLSRFHDPLNAHAPGLSMADLGMLDTQFQQIKRLFTQAVTQVHQLQPSDLQLDPRLGKALAAFQAYLPTAQTWLTEIEDLLPLAPTLLGVGAPTHYLIEMLDSTELRPTGGFIGNMGIATLLGGRLTDAHITDVYLLDYPFRAAGHIIPYPPGYSWFSRYLSSDTWSFRDSNLEPDFPTSARFGELNYMREGGKVPLQGVIAITPALIQNMLTITGPIAVPEYHETVTAQNLIERIHFHQLGYGREGNDVPSSDGHSSVRKHFTELLAEHFMARMHQIAGNALPKILQLMLTSLHTKDVQVYFNASKAEELLQRLQLASMVQTPVADNLFVVDDNISANKANPLFSDTLKDQVTLDAQGNALHHTSIRYTWTTIGKVYGSLVYRDYVRVYLPAGSTLLTQGGWKFAGVSSAYGRKVAAGSYTLIYHQAQVITLVWMVPQVAQKHAQVWHYQYEIQRQAGASWTMQVTVNLPSCARVKNTTEGLAFHNTNTATLTQSLDEDVLLGADYDCR